MASRNQTITLSASGSDNEPKLRLRLRSDNSSETDSSDNVSLGWSDSEKATQNAEEPKVLRLRLRMYRLHKSDNSKKQSDSDNGEGDNPEQNCDQADGGNNTIQRNTSDADDEYSDNESGPSPPKKKRTYQYHDRRLVPYSYKMSDRAFQRNFRMSRKKFELFLKELEPYIPIGMLILILGVNEKLYFLLQMLKHLYSTLLHQILQHGVTQCKRSDAEVMSFTMLQHLQKQCNSPC